ncbi:MAG: tyrosine-type recombinase/integrase [Nitrospiraceae bacterium]|nr:tyrosine-type recombinase/integrase [Nitrospiraceae bacterium]
MRRSFIEFWETELKLKQVADLGGVLPRVEKALRKIDRRGRSGKTLQNYADGLQAFCEWCKKRGYMDRNPLEQLSPFDNTPRSHRRAITQEELGRLFSACQPYRRLTYEMAICTGLRARELSMLRVAHLDIAGGGVYLDASWTKNRKGGFQPLPRWLVTELSEESDGKAKDDPLLYVPSHPGRDLEIDLKAAGIPKHTEDGKIDFHALRVAYVSFVLEAGASAKEAQVLARHSTPDLTMNVYARARDTRLSEVAEKVGEQVRPGQNGDTFTGNIQVTGRSREKNPNRALEQKPSNTNSLVQKEEWWRRRESNPSQPFGARLQDRCEGPERGWPELFLLDSIGLADSRFLTPNGMRGSVLASPCRIY